MHQKEKTGKLVLKCRRVSGITKLHFPAKDEVGGLTIILTPSNLLLNLLVDTNKKHLRQSHLMLKQIQGSKINFN
jgi:hypothetical protein